MDAIRARCGKRTIINIFYGSTDGCDWTGMCERAKRQCGVGAEHVAIIFTPNSMRRQEQAELFQGVLHD